MLKNTVGLSFGWISALLSAAVVFLPSCGGTGEGEGCTPNETQSCACPNNRTGVQTCASDGVSLSVCDCGDGTGGSGAGTGTTTGNGGSGGGTTQSGLCGNGNPDPGECDAGSEFPCPQDCMGTGGAGGGTTTTTSSTTDPCEGALTYGGLVPGAISAWASHPQSNGKNGYEAGIEICKSIGADHPCDYEEVLAAEAAGELAAIPMGTTAWIHRVTVAQIGGVDSPPGPGGRCNDWAYTTNHISDGEFVSFDAVGIPTYHLDNDTFYDGVDTSHAQPGQLQCNGETRAILCCYPVCN